MASNYEFGSFTMGHGHQPKSSAPAVWDVRRSQVSTVPVEHLQEDQP